jgi:RNA polymerase sigma-70 factor (ECF subfamily)
MAREDSETQATVAGGHSSGHGEVTQLLWRMKQGDHAAENQLIPLVYEELRRLAGYYLRHERHAETLQPTVLVHEAYLRLTKLDKIDWRDSSHFFGIAANVMRRILIDHARNHLAAKRDGNVAPIEIEETQIAAPMQSEELVALDEALQRLAAMDARQGKVVELRFFGGLSEEETATVLGVSSRTVKRDWRIAKAWLFTQLSV